MDPCGFMSSWVPRFKAASSPIRQSCHLYPSMNLVSHEKLEVVFSSDSSELAKYKLELEIPANFSKDKRRQSISALKKNADFKGFRKGTIPPFIMKDIPGFVLRDSIEEILPAALKELDLQPSEGTAAEPEMDIDDMLKRFNVGEDFTFTCEMALRKIISLDLAEADDLVEVKTDVDLSDAETDARRLAEAEADVESAGTPQ